MVPDAGLKPPSSGAGYYLSSGRNQYAKLITCFVWHSVSCVCLDCLAVDTAYERFGLPDDLTKIPREQDEASQLAMHLS